MAFGTCQKKEKPVILGLDEAAGHYILLVANTPEDVPMSWISAGQVDMFTNQNALRGAGGGNKASSVRWLPSKTPSRRSVAASTSEKASEVQWLPPVTPSGKKNKSAAGDSCCLPADTPGRTVSSEIRSAGSKRKNEEIVDPDEEQQASEPFIWTCNICHVKIGATSKPILSQKRADHVKYRHKGRNSEAGEIRERVPVVVASAAIPLEERVWNCPYCDAGLPHLSRYALAISRQAHMTTVHKRRLSGGQVAKKMWKKWRINPKLVPSLTAGRLSASLKMKTRNRAKMDLTKNGHDLVPVELDWSAWPAASASTSRRHVVGLTCRKCWVIFRGSCQNKNKCKGSDGKVSYPQISLWDRLRANVNRAKLLLAWGVTETQADARFDAAAGSTRKLDFDPKVMFGMNCMLTL